MSRRRARWLTIISLVVAAHFMALAWFLFVAHTPPASDSAVSGADYQGMSAGVYGLQGNQDDAQKNSERTKAEGVISAGAAQVAPVESPVVHENGLKELSNSSIPPTKNPTHGDGEIQGAQKTQSERTGSAKHGGAVEIPSGGSQGGGAGAGAAAGNAGNTGGAPEKTSTTEPNCAATIKPADARARAGMDVPVWVERTHTSAQFVRLVNQAGQARAYLREVQAAVKSVRFASNDAHCIGKKVKIVVRVLN